MSFSPTDFENFERVSFNFIETEQSGYTFFITLNRPEKRNAFTPTMSNELVFALAYANSRADIWCIVIKANGPVFCAGMDLNVFQNPELDTTNNSLPGPKKTVSIGDAFRLLNKPSIAKVEGSVYAGGFLIIGGCTFVVASDEAEFSLPEVERGIFPLQVISSLLNIMSRRRALQLCILAETLDAKAAQDIGLVSHVCPKNLLNDECAAIINKILSHSPFAIGKGLETFRALGDIPEYARFGFLADQLTKIKLSEDAQEGINAFNEKRKPTWKNY